MTVKFSKVGIIGAGAMGRGIAQIAAQAGSQVLLFDSQSDAASRGRESIVAQWRKLQEKGRLNSEDLEAYGARLAVAESMQAFADCDLVIEAIVENLDIKRTVFKQLEG
ncbi:MAG: 3-hydroxyacyl-CoA dehydrogenase, partial [Gammaproteobacteria bacterium]|nr:3-hydroxyacyl-CoA dehydrogenase [Gammaproteobacteria bacterium]